MTQLRLAASNIGWAEPDDPMILSLMKELGYTGLEAAPTRLVGEAPYTKLEQAARLASRLRKEYSLCIPSLQSIWYGQRGSLFDPADAPHLADYTCRAVDFAAAISCPSLVFGNPGASVLSRRGRILTALSLSFKGLPVMPGRMGAVIGTGGKPSGLRHQFL